MKDAPRGRGRAAPRRSRDDLRALARPRLHAPASPTRSRSPPSTAARPREIEGIVALPAHGDGRARDGEAEPDAPRAARPSTACSTTSSATDEMRDPRRRTSTRTCSGSEALEITDRLSELARSLGRTFQVKFSNTLVVRNHRSFFPASEAVMYLSGGAAARHHPEPGREVPARAARRCRSRSRPAWTARTSPTAWPSASRRSRPARTCCGRAGTGGCPRYDRLEERMRAWARHDRRLRGAASAGRGRPRGGAGGRARRAAGRAARGDLRAASGEPGLYDARPAPPSSTRRRGRAPPPTALPREQNRAAPRKIGSHLVLFDCINCDKCIPVCPNDANFVYEIGAPDACAYDRFVVRGGMRWTRVPAGVFVAAQGAPDRELPGLLQRVRQLRRLLPGGRRAVHREAALLRDRSRPGAPCASATASSPRARTDAARGSGRASADGSTVSRWTARGDRASSPTA